MYARRAVSVERRVCEHKQNVLTRLLYCPLVLQEGRVKVAEKTPPSPPSRRRTALDLRSCRDRASANGSTSGWDLDLSQ